MTKRKGGGQPGNTNALVALGKECDILLAVNPPDLDALDKLVIKYREANFLATSERLKVILRFLR